MVFLQHKSEIYHIKEMAIMSKKEAMSLSKHYNLRYTLNGVVWLIYAVINLLPNNIVTKVLCIVALIMAIVTSCISLFVKADADDEMSILHISKAKAMTLDITVSLFLIIGVGSVVLGNMVVNIAKLYPFVIGVVQLLTGILFWLEERTSD